MKTINIYGDNYLGNIQNKRIAVRAFIIKDGSLLMTYEKKTDQLMIPGGGVLKDESNKEALIREIEEETGYLINVEDLVVRINEYYDDTLYINDYYICDIIGLGIVHLTKEEIDNELIFKWVNLNDGLNLLKSFLENSNNFGTMKYGLYKREYTALLEYFNYSNLELWDLYNCNRTKLNQDHIRGTLLKEGMYHLVVQVWIKNRANKYLISKRASSRKSFPGMLECVGGSVLKDENTYSAAIREVYEEVGIDLSNIEGKLVHSFRRDEYQDIVDVYLFECDVEANLFNATTDEVEDVRWCTKDEVFKLLDEQKLMHTLAYFKELVENKIL